MTTLERRVVRLEGIVAGPAPSYVVFVPPEALGDEEAVGAAIAKHRRRTGREWPVIVLPPVLTKAEWLRRYGRND